MSSNLYFCKVSGGSTLSVERFSITRPEEAKHFTVMKIRSVGATPLFGTKLREAVMLCKTKLRSCLNCLSQRAIITWMIVSMGTAGGIAAFGISVVMLTASPAQASCLVGGVIRDDISDEDCLEAQRTGCIRSKLSPAKYMECLAAQPSCLLGGSRRTDLPGNDCFEAQRTGCVRNALTPTQYQDCLLQQPVCLIGTELRPDLKGLDCIEAQRTGCVRSMLTPAGYKGCLEAQPQ